MRAGIAGATPNEQYRLDEEDKIRFSVRMESNGLPVPKTLAVIGSRQDTDQVWTKDVIESHVTLEAFIRASRDLDAICKPARGGQGWDILSLQARGGDIQPGADYVDSASFFERLQARGYSRFCWILQQREEVHPELRRIMPGRGLGTIRIHSALSPGGNVLLRWPTLKIPGGNAISDNWQGGRRGGLIVPIDLESGKLGKAVGRLRPGARSEFFWSHPVSGARIEGIKVPYWQQTLDLVERAARLFTTLPALGWDVAVTPSGPVVIETNWQFGFELPQTAHRRGLRDEIEALFAFTR